MKPNAAQIQDTLRRYLKIVEWSEADRCYVGSAPPLVGQACHGTTEAEVLTQLQAIVEEWVETLLTDGKPLPPATAGKNLGEKLQRVA